MGSISHPVLLIFVYIVAYKYLRSTKKSILHQQLFCRHIKSYLIAVFRLICYIFFAEAFIFISFTFYLPTKMYLWSKIKIPLALFVCFGVVLKKKRHRPCSFYLSILWHNFLSVAMYNVIKTENIFYSFLQYVATISDKIWT